MTDRKDRIARAICAERCAEYGEPPCYVTAEDGTLSPDCGVTFETTCEQLAAAVKAELTREVTDDQND